MSANEKELLKQTLELHTSLTNLVHSAVLGIYDGKPQSVDLTLENSQGPDWVIAIKSYKKKVTKKKVTKKKAKKKTR